MATAHVPSRPFRTAAIASVSLAMLWIALAALNPTTTYHLAPVLVAGALPVLTVLDGEAQISAQLLASAAGGGLAAALATSFLIGGFGWAEGPSLLPAGGAVLESVVFSITGAAAGYGAGLAVRTRQGVR